MLPLVYMITAKSSFFGRCFSIDSSEESEDERREDEKIEGQTNVRVNALFFKLRQRKKCHRTLLALDALLRFGLDGTGKEDHLSNLFCSIEDFLEATSVECR